ncbi:MAG TPA: PASTA domain-containing protein, partial [Acidimicrobiales bacterium]|nr:PASTA domain-containing protein [Acidimicrobiales bacterium]
TRGSGTASKAIPGDLVGQPLAKDQAELRQLGFTHVGTATVQSSLAAGLVAATNPAAGTPTPLSDLVTLRVSSGPAPVAVPDVTGQPQAAATATLQAAGLKVATAAPQPSATVPSGSVISTDPPAGTSAPTGSTVTLTVSSGQQQVTIPNLTGQDGSTAGNKLGQLGLSVTTRYEASTKVQPGKVTRTDPAAGTPVPVGQTIVLYVSQGTTAPNVVGQAQQDAIAAVQAAGLNPTVQGQAVTDPSQDGVVQAESPAGGTGGLAPGSTVTLTVGHYTAPSTTTSSSTTSTTTTVPTSSTTSSSVTSPTTARTTTVP